MKTDLEYIREKLGYTVLKYEVRGKGSADTRAVRQGKRKKSKHLNHIVWGA